MVRLGGNGSIIDERRNLAESNADSAGTITGQPAIHHHAGRTDLATAIPLRVPGGLSYRPRGIEPSERMEE